MKEFARPDGTAVIFDTLELAPYGVARVTGWSAGPVPELDLVSSGLKTAPFAVYRRNRPDVPVEIRRGGSFLGFSIEFKRVTSDPFALFLDDEIVVSVSASQAAALVRAKSQFNVFFDGDDVLHRAQIYGEGPPVSDGHPDIIAFAMGLSGPILDFGCGGGYMLQRWKDAGIECQGIEIDRPAIREALRADMAGQVTLYDGSFPLPFEDGQFETVFSSEVVEHVPNYLEAIAEIARITRSTFAITVPDMACLPIGSTISLVPWHLLESTHVNFFSRRSLEKVLSSHFSKLDFFNLGPGLIDNMYMPGSLGCIARKI